MNSFWAPEPTKFMEKEMISEIMVDPPLTDIDFYSVQAWVNEVTPVVSKDPLDSYNNVQSLLKTWGSAKISVETNIPGTLTADAPYTTDKTLSFSPIWICAS